MPQTIKRKHANTSRPVRYDRRSNASLGRSSRTQIPINRTSTYSRPMSRTAAGGGRPLVRSRYDKNRRRKRIERRLVLAALLLVLISVIVLVALGVRALCVKLFGSNDNADLSTVTDPAPSSLSMSARHAASDMRFRQPITEQPIAHEEIVAALPQATASTVNFSSEIDSQYAVLIDVEDNTILARRGCTSRIYPASLTKVMTVLVAVENVEDIDTASCVMTYDILNPLINASASRAGFWEGEEISFTDLLYGAILPSGADATVGLAIAVSGSEEEFVKLMNKKAEELGLSNTHFTNTSGLHSTNHYSTPLEMAVIMKAAMDNPICKEVLSAYKYTTAPTEHFPQGIELTSNMFSRMYGTEVPGVTVIAGKTGYTDEARHCLVSCAVKDGREYVAVTAMGSTKWEQTYDCLRIYENYLPKTAPAAVSELTQTSETTAFTAEITRE